jgi:hypothetical protein
MSASVRPACGNSDARASAQRPYIERPALRALGRQLPDADYRRLAAYGYPLTRLKLPDSSELALPARPPQRATDRAPPSPAPLLSPPPQDAAGLGPVQAEADQASVASFRTSLSTGAAACLALEVVACSARSASSVTLPS